MGRKQPSLHDMRLARFMISIQAAIFSPGFPPATANFLTLPWTHSRGFRARQSSQQYHDDVKYIYESPILSSAVVDTL
jgi:hypothetical protein